jgi:hypothetical protein
MAETNPKIIKYMMSKRNVQYQDIQLKEIQNDYKEIVHDHYEDHSEKTRMHDSHSVDSGGESIKISKKSILNHATTKIYGKPI